MATVLNIEVNMSQIISIDKAKQQRSKDEEELARVRNMTEQLYRTIEFLNERERELVNRLDRNKPKT